MPVLICQEAGGPRREIPLKRARFTFGKMPDNDLVLDRQNISRKHCQVFSEGNKWFVRDLASRNGTFLNSQKILSDTELLHGAQIQLGDFTITFQADGQVIPAAGAPGSGGAGASPAAAPAVPKAPSRLVPPELKKRIHQRLLTELDLKHVDYTQASNAEVRNRTAQVLTRIVEEFGAEVQAPLTKGDVIQQLLDEALGLGPLEDLLADPEIDEIMVNAFDRMYVERKGKLHLTDRHFADNDHVIQVIRRIIAPIGRRIDESSPMVDARLQDGSRVNAIIHPLSLKGPTLTIRKFSKTPYTTEDLIRFGSLTPGIAKFLQLCVENRRNLLISGGTGSGKTTLLNVISSYIPRDERIVTIEDAAELKLGQDHVVSLEARPPNIEGVGEIPIRKLVINALRMRPDRIVVGECRGGEALDMLQAMNTGHDGSLTTLHANTPRDALTRLETLVLMAGMELPAKSIRQQVAAAVNLIVQIARLSDGTRRLTSLTELTGMEGEVITMQEIFTFEQTGIAQDGKVLGRLKPTGVVPKFVHRLRQSGRNIDLAIFQEPPPQTEGARP